MKICENYIIFVRSTTKQGIRRHNKFTKLNQIKMDFPVYQLNFQAKNCNERTYLLKRHHSKN